MALSSLPPQYQSVFSVSTLRRTHYYAVANDEEAQTWVRSLNQARQESVTRSMGHSQVPYPKSWELFDSLGKNLVRSKERIKAKLADHNLRELEMTGFGGP